METKDNLLHDIAMYTSIVVEIQPGLLALYVEELQVGAYPFLLL